MRKFPFLALPALAVYALGALYAAPSGAAAPTETATLILRGGKVVTLDEKKPEARAIAIRGERILAVGTDEEVGTFLGPATQVIDLKGALAIPGFIDSHAHFSGIGQVKLGLDLTTAASWDEIVAQVAKAVTWAKPGEWIVGRGWHQEKWKGAPKPNVEGFPVHDALSKVSPENPVLLTHASGHAAFANAVAMNAASVTRETPNPAGGEILKDAAGRPTGLFRETAAGLLSKAYAAAREKRKPEEVDKERRRVLELAAEECLSKGVTSVHDPGVSFETAELYRKVAQEGKLGVRLHVMIREEPAALAANLAKARTVGFAGNFVTVRAIKVTIDGALGSRGAWLLAPYTDLATSTGLNTVTLPDLRETARLALQHDYQLCVHAIGDRANRETLDVYEEAWKGRTDGKSLRWRIEHAQHLDPADIPRFGKLGVLAAMQGIHCTSDAPFVPARLGAKRSEDGAYVWQKLMKSGALISNGTDAPVEDVDPIASFHASVSRKLKNGSVFYGDQRMSRMEALRSYNVNGAYAAFEEGLKGSLTPGKLADIAVLSKDILTIPEDEIPSARVVTTIVGGKVSYRAKGR